MTNNSKMTADRFRQHYYGSPKGPYWERNFHELKFGIEVEYIIHAIDDPSRLLRRLDYFKLINMLLELGYSRYFDNEKVGRVSKNIQEGFIKICPDFAYHILEISLPPFSHIENLKSQFQQITSEIDEALRKIGFTRSKKSYTELNNYYDIVVEKRLEGSIEAFKNDKKSSFSSSSMAGMISSTHVHFNIGEEKDLELLPRLYEIEWIAQSLFSKHYPINGKNVPSVRTLLYKYSFGNDYPLVNIPDNLPCCVDSYVDLYNRCKPLFPNDNFSPARDFTIIRPTAYRTFEFRASDPAFNFEDLTEIIAFRLLQLKYTVEQLDKDFESSRIVSERYIELAENCKAPRLEAEHIMLDRVCSIDTKAFEKLGIDETTFIKIKDKMKSLK